MATRTAKLVLERPTSSEQQARGHEHCCGEMVAWAGSIHEAVRRGHQTIVAYMLENGAFADSQDAGGSTALHIAAGVGEVGMVELLLPKGTVLEMQDGTERRAVHVAAQAGHVDVTAALLAAGADVGARYGAYSLSTLEVAARNGRAGVAHMLIERGVNVNTTGMEGSTPVHQAAHGGSAPAIDMLAKAGANIDERNIKRATPLHLAAMHCYLEVALALLRHGAEVTEILTPLHLAAGFAGSERAAEMVDLLLRWGADESVTDEEGRKAGGFVLVDACCGWIAQGVQDTQPAESEQRVRQLLANAPADRTCTGGGRPPFLKMLDTLAPL